MKIKREDLRTALEKVRPGLASKERIEQTTSFAFLDGRVVTYNDEVSISHPVAGLESIRGAVKAQALFEFLGRIKKDEIELEKEENQIIIKAGRAKAGLVFDQTMRLPLDEIEKASKWTQLPEDFTTAVQMCLSCCSKDMSRPVLTCLHASKNVVEASDGYQIIRYTLKSKVSDKGFLIPATSANLLTRYPIKEVDLSERWIHFRTDDGTVFSSRILADNFPDVSGFLNADGEEFTFPDSMQEVVHRAVVFAKKELDETSYASRPSCGGVD